MMRLIIIIHLAFFSGSLGASDKYYSYWNYCEGYMYKFDFESGRHKAYQYYKVDGKDSYKMNEFKLKKESEGIYLTGDKNASKMYFDNDFNPIKIELAGQSVKFVNFNICPTPSVEKMMKGIESNN